MLPAGRDGDPFGIAMVPDRVYTNKIRVTSMNLNTYGIAYKNMHTWLCPIISPHKLQLPVGPPVGEE